MPLLTDTGIMEALVWMGAGGGQLAELTSRKKACLFLIPENSAGLFLFTNMLEGQKFQPGFSGPVCSWGSAALRGAWRRSPADRSPAQCPSTPSLHTVCSELTVA